MSEPLLAARDLVVRRNGRVVLDVAALAVAKGEVLAVIGPNGAGKSTLLETLALLRPADGGEIRFGGQVVGRGRDQLAYRRRMAVAFQEPLLLDTTVFENVASGLRLRAVNRRELGPRVAHWLAQFAIAHLAGRPARAISGGEAQRTSLARAFVLQPEVLFLDEPFSALDAPSRAALLADLGAILEQTGVTTVLITHERGEALALADRLAVLLAGQIRQVGPPEAVFGSPVDEEVAAFVGVETILPGRVVAQEDGLASVEVHAGLVEAVSDRPAGESVLVCLRPEDVVIAVANGGRPTSARNRLHGHIRRLTPLGSQVRVAVDCGFPVVSLITRRSYLDLALQEGQPVYVSFKASAVHLIGKHQHTTAAAGD